MTLDEKIEAAIADTENGTDFKVITEVKAMLNAVYGEERNQISRPTVESVKKRASDLGADISRVVNMTPAHVISHLKLSITDSLSYQIIIHFPEFTIENGEREHLIRNMYVRLFLRPNGTLSTQMYGMRTTFTEAEFLSQYVHSHLPRGDFNPVIFHQFCTGVGEINQVLALLNTKFTAANFMMLLMHIKNFLEWESKEGHPFMFIENIFSRSPQGSVYNALPEYVAALAADTMITLIRRHMNLSDIMDRFTFAVNDRSIVVTATLEVEKWMAGMIERWDVRTLFNSGYDLHYFLSLRDNTGAYHCLPAGTSRMIYQQGTILNFKGRNIEFEIIERSQTQTHETFANPKITKETCKKLSRILTKAALSTPGIRSGDSLVYSTRASNTDPLSV